jgi:N6-L-threonylcarbamoyladenine synthase
VITLGIETSCDETSVAVVKDGRKILSNVVFSSLAEHKKYGGVVPEIASRSHLEVILRCLDESRRRSRVPLSRVNLVAVTQGPGLMGSLLVGISAAKALAFSLQKPLVGVDHVLAHIYAGRLADPRLRFPFLGLAVSGGHTLLVRMASASEVRVLGRTLDDAAGEAFDKVAKILGLGYPGGPEIDRLGRGEDPGKFYFSRPLLSKDSLDFSFSGIKTAVYYLVERLKKTKPLDLKTKKQICAGFQEAVCEVLVKKAVQAMKKHRLDSCVVGGGVSANSRLRRMLTGAAAKEGFRVVFPPLLLCQDNAAMIAALGTALYKAGQRDGLDLAGYADFSHV